MKKYVVVHLPVNVKNPMPIPIEQLNDFIVNKNNLYYEITPSTKIKGTLLSKYALPNDYVLNENNQLLGQIENTITFQNVADLFLGDSIFSLRQPLQDQIKFNQLNKHSYKKDNDQDIPNTKEQPNWVIKYSPHKVVPPLKNLQLMPIEQIFYDIFQKRKALPMQLIEYFNKQKKLNLTTPQLLVILRKIAFQYLNGPFRQIWFIKGYAPEHIGEKMLDVRYQEYVMAQCQEGLRSLSNEQYNILKLQYPTTFQQLDLLFINNKIQIYKQVKDYKVFQEKITQNEQIDILQIKNEIKQQLDVFFNNALCVIQLNGKEARDDVKLLDMENIDNNKNLGPKIEEQEEIQQENGEEQGEEIEQSDYDYSYSGSG